jgi:hypothetical protein
LFLSRQNKGAAIFFQIYPKPRPAQEAKTARAAIISRAGGAQFTIHGGFGKFPASLIMKGGATVKNILPA